MSDVNLCLHCDPYPNDSAHTPEKVTQFLLPLTIPFIPLEHFFERFPQLHRALKKNLVRAVFEILLAIRFLIEVEAEDSDEELHNRSLVVIREARQRGIPIKVIKNIFGKSTNHFTIQLNGTKKIFECFPHLTLDSSSSVAFDDKGKFKALLREEGLPFARGAVFQEYVSAARYVQSTIGFPVVVKPKSGSLSKHTTCNIRNERELQEAVSIVKIISKEFVVEEHIDGDVHRVTLINGNVVASCRRESPNVIGDGVHTVRELIEIKNKNPNRGASDKKNFTLHKIPISARTHTVLASQQMTLDGVPALEEKVYVHDKVVLACGADIHDTTDNTHPENALLFRKVYELCQAPLIGIDFISMDISKSYRKQKSAIIEVNSLPYIDMHHYPVTGKEKNVAAHILDYYISLTVKDTR